MYPKYFFERFWEGEQRNELFVCMPFHPDLDSRFYDLIDSIAKKVGFDRAQRVSQNTEANVITDKIFDGIAHSKMILIDLSDDPKSKGHANGNVLYEAGIAQTIREPSSIIIIREEDPSTADFDVRGFTINTPSDRKITFDWLYKLLKDGLINHNWSEAKRVKAVAESIDDYCLDLILKIASRPDGFNHFNTMTLAVEYKFAVLRLIDLGLVRFATGREKGPAEHAYWWTPFAYEVMKCLGVRRIKKDYFVKTNEYLESLKAKEKFLADKKAYEEFRKNINEEEMYE